MHCTECGRPRRPGRTICGPCRNAARRERYAHDHEYRSGEKRRYNEWRDTHKPERAEAERLRRLRLQEATLAEND